MEKFKNKYRIQSARAPWWNYANDGAYFITICTFGREHLFGEIQNEQMILSEIGKIAWREWNKSFGIRSELFCDAVVIMPNHIHAIVRIENLNLDDIAVETHGRASLPPHTSQTNHTSRQSNTRQNQTAPQPIIFSFHHTNRIFPVNKFCIMPCFIFLYFSNLFSNASISLSIS